MRVGHELERSADLMVNVAKTTRRLYPHQLDPKLRGIIDRMGTQASVQTRVAIDAFADADPSQAAALADMDDAMDELTKSLFRHILAGDGSDEGTVLLAVQMALVGRHYERTADHAVTIAERVRFMVTGEHPARAIDADALALFVVAEVPLEDEVLALGVARHPLTVAPELRVVGREELQTGQRALAELVDHAAVAEDPVHLPVGRHRAEVDDLHVPLGRDLFEDFGLHRHARRLVARVAASDHRPDCRRGPPRASTCSVTLLAVALDDHVDRVADGGSRGWQAGAAPTSRRPARRCSR